MNRNRKGVMPEITRAMYKDIKKYDRQQFTGFCTDLYGYGFEDGKAAVPGVDINHFKGDRGTFLPPELPAKEP